MSNKIVITKANIQHREYLLSGLISNDHLAEVRLEKTDAQSASSILGNIYIGKVQKILSNINAAFIEIQPGLACYYPLSDGIDPVYIKKTSNKVLAQNDEILVQVQKESVKTKAPTVSTNLNLTGRYVVVTNEKKSLGISSKISREKREYYKELISHQSQRKYGIIIRTNAANASDAAILAEINALSLQMEEMISFAQNRTCFTCMKKGQPKYLTFVQNMYRSEVEEIVTDQKEVYDIVKEYCSSYEDMQHLNIRYYEDASYPLMNLYNLNKQMERVTQKNVWLKSGGFLVIEPTEALTVIDVNTGKSVSKKNEQEHFMEVNLEASQEIAAQLRLRNISGIIIVDYINLNDKTQLNQMMEHLKKLLKMDPVPTQVHDITRLNLVEITRKKVEKSIYEQLK